MDVQFLDEGERLIARPHGRLDAAGGVAFAATVEQHLHDGTRLLVIDFEQLDFLAFAGIRALLRVGRTLKARNTGIAFTNANGEVFEALDASGLDEIFAFLPMPPSNMGNQDAQNAP
jgi:anti-anti-sigma factor